jgi:signal recognition particle receptor subunit beta
MVENTGKIEGVGGGRGVMSLVDFPGHFRLRCVRACVLACVCTLTLRACVRACVRARACVCACRHNMITMLESVKPRRVVFVVDSSAGLAHMKEAAEGLYDLLSCKTVQDLQCPILLLCNKQDVAGAKAPADVHAGLMKQMCVCAPIACAASAS